MSTSARGGNAARSEAARERVLQATLRALATNGYQGSSLAGIAEAAGLTTAGLLHHFPSKEQLLVAVLAERDRSDGARHHLRASRAWPLWTASSSSWSSTPSFRAWCAPSPC
jgi:AcrR family transcriptional regulator